MKPKRTNPLFASSFGRNILASAIVCTLSGSAMAQTLYWDTNAATAGSGNAAGTWDSGTNWSTDSTGASATAGWTDGQAAVFSAGTDGTGAWTATIAGPISTPSILVEEAGAKTIAGGTINIGAGSIHTAAAGNGNAFTISSLIAGSGGLTINANGDTSDTGGGAGGMLILSGANTISGDITINSGVVRSNSGFGGSGNKLILNGGGIVDANLNTNIANNIEIPATKTGVYRAYGSVATGQLSGAITGSGTLLRSDGGTVTLNCNFSAFTGTFRNGQGTTVIGAAAATTMAAIPVIQADGGNVLRLGAAGDTTILSLTSDRDLVVPFGSRLNIANGTYSTVGAGSTYNGFWAQGTSAGSAAATGEITSSSGTLNITNGAATGDLTTTDNRLRLKIVDFNGSTPLAVTKNNRNLLNFDMVNTYTGGTTINGGRINADNVSAFGTGTVTVNTNGQAYPTVAGTFANNFVINGLGTTEAAGQLGAIRFQGNTISGSINVATAARMVAYGTTGTHSGALTGSAALDLNLAASPGTISFTGNTSGYTGTLTLNAGTLNIGATGLGGSLNVVTGTANVTGGIATNLTASGTAATVGGTIGGNVLSNVGTTNLNGAVTGSVTVNAGRTNINANVGGGVSVIDAAKIGGEAAITGTLNLGSSSGADLHVNAITPGALSAGTVNLTGTNNVFIDVLPSVAGEFSILEYTTLGAGNETNFLVPTGVYRGNPEVQHDIANSRFTLQLDSQERTWSNAALTGSWNTTDLNWAEGDNLFFSGDNVVFTNTAVGTVNLSTGLQPLSITLENTVSNNYVFTGGSIIGTTGISMTGGGNLTLGGTNTFTGSVSVASGQLTTATSQALGLTSGVTVADGAAVDLNGQTPGTLATGGYTYTIEGTGIGGTGALKNTGAGVFSNAGVKSLVLTDDATINAVGRFDIGFANVAGSGTITGNGHTLTKIGAGGVGMRGNASATPITIQVNEGDLWAENDDNALGGATGSVSTSGTARVGSFGTRNIATPVNLGAGTSFMNLGGGTATWTGAITLGGGVTFDVGGNTAVDGTLSGSGNITRTNANVLSMQSDSSGFSGKFVNNGGTLRVETNAALGTATGADRLTMAGGTTLQGGTIAALASATVGSATQGITHTGTGNVFYDSGAGNTLTIAGPVAGGVTNIATQNGTVAFSNTVTLFDPANAAANLTVRNNSTVSFLSGANASVRNIALGENGQGNSSNMSIATGATVTTTRLVTGDGGSVTSVVNQTGGTFNVTGNANSGTGASFLMGHWGGGTSTYNLSDGIINAPAAALSLGWDTVGANFNQSGGTANFAGLNLNNGRTNAASYNLTGGRLNIGASGITSTTNKSVNLGGGTVGAFGSWIGAKPMTITGTGGNTTFNTLDSVDGTTPRTITLTGALANSGGAGFTKTGAGVLSLNSVAGAFNGTATVNGGSLMVNGASLAAGAVEVDAGGAIQAGTIGATGAGSVTSLTLDGGTAAVRVGATNDLINVTGIDAFTVSSASSITALPAGPIAGPFPITYTVLDYNGVIGGLGFAGLSYNSANPHLSGSLINDVPNTQIQVQITAADTVIWKGDGDTDGNWDVNASSNWVLGSDGVTASKYYDFDVVTFDDTGISAPNVNLVGTITPATLAVSNTSGTYVFSGSGIGGSTGLIKSGAGGLTLLNSNTYGGSTSIAGGTVTVGNGGTVGSLGGAGTINLATGANLVLDRSDAQTLGRAVTGGGTLVSDGGNLNMSVGGNSCDIIVNSGTLVARGGGFSAAFDAGKMITVNPGAVLDTAVHSMGSSVGGGGDVPMVTLNGSNWILNGEQYMRTLNMTGATTTKVGVLDGIRTLSGSVYTINGAATSSTIGSPLNLVNAVNLVVDDGAATNDLVITGLVSNAGAVTKTGDGTMVLAGTNTSTGSLTISAGIVQVGDGTTNGVLGTGAVINDASLVMKRSDALSVTNTISGTGDLTQDGTGTTTLGGTNTYTGDTIVKAGVLAIDGDSITDVGALVIDGGKVDVTGIEVVGTLYYGATQQNAGTYGSTASTATFQDDTRFSGTGVIQVTTGPIIAGYDTWATQITNVADRDRTDDPDGDGFTNIQEFLFGTSPIASNGALVSTSATGGNLVLRWQQRETGSSYSLLESTTLGLGSWTAVVSPVPAIDVDQTGALTDYDFFKVTIPIGSGKNFYRIEGVEN